MKQVLLVFAVPVAIAAAFSLLTLPPGARPLEPMTALPPLARGAIHVHTRRSDGTGTPERIAAAAARAGLRFVILTDHGDASREPDAPRYVGGVLLIDAVEISTDGGHVVALGLPKAPYPLAGEARDVLEDIRRLGGFGIAAHPGSAKPELQWREWTPALDGLEWLNGDSEWRDEPRRTLAHALLTYPVRPAETLARILDRSATIMRRWDAMTAVRPVVALAAGDAHARIGLRSGEPTDNSIAVHLPSYEAVFRTMSITVSPVTLTGDPAADASAIVNAIRAGHVYSSIDALAAPASLSFTAMAGSARATAGDTLDPGQQIELRVETNAPDGSRVVLLRNGAPLNEVMGKGLTHGVAGEPAVYRTEVHLPRAPGEPPVPWIVSNPIYVRFAGDPPPSARPPAKAVAALYEEGPVPGAAIEASPRSGAEIDVVRVAAGGTQLSVRWAIGGSLGDSPYAALVIPAGAAIRGYDRLTFTARADRQMRVSVQVRVPTPGGGERWHRSVYLDETPRAFTVFFDEMTPRGVTSQPRPPLPDVRDVLVVIDTVNTKPGTSGVFWLDDVKYGR